MMRGKLKISSSALRGAAISALVILFFLGVIIAYYVMLISETRQRIIKSNELIAATSAQEINTYLSNGVYAMQLVCHELDNLLRDESPQHEIRSFLLEHFSLVKSITSGNAASLYGLFNGEHITGDDWVPPPDFVPTERPWYIAARANSGQVAVVDPYIDARTKTMMLSFSKMLCDAKSVAAMDFSLAPLQSITEELAARNESDMEIVLDMKYRVIAHSDSSELGKNYLAEDGTFGKALVNALRSSGNNHFSFNFGGAVYIAYTVSVANDWLCLSVFDATSSFSRLRNLLIFTIVTSVLVVSVLSVIMVYSSRKASLARKFNEKAERADAASKAKSAFLSNMSHEIRTPINAILGMNEMILSESGDRQSIVEYSENIRNAGNRLLGLVNDILDFSKIDTGKMEIVPIDYDISSLINDLAGMIQAKTEEKGLLLKLDFDETMPRLLHGDEVRIKQAATNILTNAVKYTQKGSITFHIGCERIPDEPDSVSLDFSVSDTGIGIRPEDMEKLFTEFERIEEKRNRNIAGTGLGLNITKRLLEMMGSELKVESVYGKGATFSFRLKQKVVRWEALGSYEVARRTSPQGRKESGKKFTAPDARVLAVDDTPMNLTVFRGLLKSTKMQIDTAESGGEGLTLSRNKKYDIIVLDHMMPEMDGIETLHELRADANNPNLKTPVICLTANAIAGAREKYLAEGFDDYLTKPIEGADLEAAILKYLPPEKVTIQEAADNDFAETPEETTELRAFYASVPELNYGDAIRFCANEEVLKDTLEQFYRAIKPNITAIDGFLRSKDYKNYTIKVHALKSSARLIGAEALSADARHLEDLGNSLTQNDIKRIEELTPSLLEDYQKFLERLSPLYAAEEAARASAPEISVSDLNEAYDAIKQFVESFDIDAIDGFIVEIRKYRIPEPEKAKFAAVEECVRNMDWIGLEEALKG